MEKLKEEVKDNMNEKSVNNGTSNSIMQEEIKLLDLNQQVILPKNEYSFNILFFGNNGVGKTSIIRAICGEKVNVSSKHIPTLCCDKRSKKFKVNENTIIIHFFDFGKIDLNVNLQVISQYINIAHAVVYVTDLSDISSLSIVEKLTLTHKNDESIRNYLLINKNDLKGVKKEDEILAEKNIRLAKLVENSTFNLKNVFYTSITEKETVINFFNSLLGNLIEFFENVERRKFYLEKVKFDNLNFFFKYKGVKKNKKCFYC